MREHTPRRARSAWLLPFVIPLLFACGGGSPTENDPDDAGGGGGGGNNNPPVAQANVSMTTSDDGYSNAINTFTPNSVNLMLNGTITWSNSTGIMHNVTFASPIAPANVPNMSNGSTSRSFASAGTFVYSCSNHTSMTGTINVSP